MWHNKQSEFLACAKQEKYAIIRIKYIIEAHSQYVVNMTHVF